MKKATVVIPEIIRNLNPVTERFGPLSEDSDQMQLPATVTGIPGFIYQLLTASEQKICDSATD